MGNILRRVTAFLLGIVFTITALVGGVVGGAYYAYKNISPIEDIIAPNDKDTEDALGDLYGASIEELVDLIFNAMDSDKNGEYTFDRLAKEYGLDLAKLLEKMGVDMSKVDTSSGDWKALEGVSLLSVFSDPMKMLDSIKLKALYVLVPGLTGHPISDFLAPEAQSALGEYTITDLIGADEATGELGIVKAIKGLKIGSFLPEIFDSTYDVSTHEYKYTVKEDGAFKDLKFLEIIASVPLQGVFNIIEGGDVMTELLEGEFKPITAMPIADILDMFAAVAGEEVAGVISQYTQVFGDVSVADLFEKDENGNYTFAYENLLSGLELGYLAGLTKVDDKWVDKDGNEATGLLGFVAGISIGDILENKGDVVGMINAAAGDLSLLTIYETIFEPDEDGRYPIIIERLGSIKVSDILGDGQENIIDNLKLSLKIALEGTTLRDAVYSFVDETVQEQLESIVIVDALLDIRIDEFIRDEYTPQAIIQIFNDAIGHLTIGEISGVTPTNEALALLMDYRIGQILDGVIAILDGDKSPTEIVDSFIGQYTVGEVFGALTGYEYSEAEDNWVKDGYHIAKGLVPLMKMPISYFVSIFDKEFDFDIMSVVGDIQIADVVYTVLQVCGIHNILEETTVNDKITYTVGGDFKDLGPLSEVVLMLTVNDFVNHATDGQFWLDHVGKVSIGDLVAYVVNQLLNFNVKLVYNNGNWEADSDYLADVITNVSNTTIGGIVRVLKTGDMELIKQKVFNKLGDTNIGDILYTAFEITGLKGIISVATTESGYQMTTEYQDLNNLTQPIFALSIVDIVENATNVDWWFEKLGGIRLGDPFVYFINKYAPDMSVTVDEAGDWVVNGTMGAVLTDLFNITVSELRDPDVVQFIKDTFGHIKIGDIVGSFVPEDMKANKFMAAVLDITVLDIINTAQSQTIADLVYNLQEMFLGVTVRDVAELFSLKGFDYGVFNRIFGTELEFLIGLIGTKDIVGDLIYEYGELSVGEIFETVVILSGGQQLLDQIYAIEDIQPLLDKVLSITLKEVLENLNAEYWIQRFGKISFGDLLAYFINSTDEIAITLVYSNGTWGVASEYVPAFLQNAFNTTLGGVYNVLSSGDPEYIKAKIIENVGTLTIGELAHAGLGICGVTGVILVGADGTYELAEQYAELNDLAEKVFDIKVVDIVENYNNVDFWIGIFGETTVGDAIDIALPEEMEVNPFLLAVRNISVNNVVGLVRAETLPDLVYQLQDIFEGVNVQHILDLVGAPQVTNNALLKLVDTELAFFIGLISSPDILGEIVYEFGDISLYDAVAQYIEEFIPVDNTFIYSTLSFNVADVIAFITAKSSQEVLDIIYNKYQDVLIADFVELFTPVPVGQPYDTVYEIYLVDLIKAIVEGRMVEFLKDRFATTTLGDIAYIINGTAGMTAIVQASTDTGYALDAKYEELENLAQVIFGIGVIELVDNIDNPDWYLGKFGTTTVGDVVDIFLSEEVEANNFVAAVRSIDGRYIYDFTLIETRNGLIAHLQDVFDENVLVQDIFSLFGLGDFGNKALAKVLDTPLWFLLELVVTQDMPSMIHAEFGDITIGDAVADYIPVTGNAFLDATYTFGVDHVFRMLATSTAAEALQVVQEVYADVTFADALALAGVSTGYNDALDKLLDTTIPNFIGLFLAEDNLTAVRNEFGDITLGDAIGTVLPADIATNAFMDATLDFSVETVFAMALATNQTEIADALESIYLGIKFGDLVSLFFPGAAPTETVQTIFDVELIDLLRAIIENNLFTFLYETFGDERIGDIVFSASQTYNILGYTISYVDNQWLATVEGDKLDTLLTNILNTRLGTIYDDIENQEQLKQDLIDLVGDTTVREFGELVYVNELGIGVVDKVYNVALSSVIKAAFNGTFLYLIRDFACSITIYDVVGFLLNEQLQNNAFIKASLSISTNTVLDIIEAGSAQAILNTFADLYVGVIFGDIASIFGVTEAPLNVLTPIFAGKLDGLLRAIADGTIIDYVITTLGPISIGDIVSDAESLSNTVVIPEDMKTNNFISAVLGVDVETVYGITQSENVVTAIGEIFVGATVGDVVELFTTIPELDYVQTVCGIDIGQTIIDLANNDTTALVETLKTAFSQLPPEVQYCIIAGVGAVGVILYFADNPLLCQIVDTALGADATWGDVLASDLGYTFDGVNYTNDIGYNGLLDFILKEDVTDTLTTGYPLLTNIKDHLTIANIITSHVSLADNIALAIGMEFMQTEKGFALNNEFKYFTDNLFNLPLGAFLTEDNKLKVQTEINSMLYLTFKDNHIGDFVAYFMNTYNILNTTATKDGGYLWKVEGDYLPSVIENVLNVTLGGIYRGLVAQDKTYYYNRLVEVFGDLSVGELVYTGVNVAGVEGVIVRDDAQESGYAIQGQFADFSPLAQPFFAVNVRMIVENVNNGEFWLNHFGKVSYGDLFAYVVNNVINKDITMVDMNGDWYVFAPYTQELIENVANTTLIGSFRTITSGNVDLIVEKTLETLGATTFIDLVAPFGITETPNVALNKVLDTVIAELIQIIFSDNIVGGLLEEFSDISVGDIIGITHENAFVNASLGFSVGHVARLVEDFRERIICDVFGDVYLGVTLEDVITLFAPTFVAQKVGTQELIQLDIGQLLKCPLAGDYTYFLNFLKHVYKSSTTRTQVIVSFLGVGGSTVLYLINNELVCYISDEILGKGAKFSRIYEMLGYQYNVEDGSYTLNGIRNPLVDAVFEKEITTVLADGYPIIETFKPYITLGNILYGHSGFVYYFEQMGLKISQDEEGDFVLPGYLKNISKTLLNVSLDKFLTADNKFLAGADLINALLDVFGNNYVGDVLVLPLANAKLGLNIYYDTYINEWVAIGSLGDMWTGLMNITVKDFVTDIQNKAYVDLLIKAFGPTTIGELIKLLNPSFTATGMLGKFVELPVSGVLKVFAGQESIYTYVGDWTLEEIIGASLPDNINKNAEFTKTFLAMTLNELSELKTNASAQLMAKFGNFTFAELLAVFGYAGSATDPIVTSILELKINIFERGIDDGLDQIMNTIKDKQIGLLLGYTKEADGTWTKDGAIVEGAMAKIADSTINELSSDTQFINNLTLGEVIVNAHEHAVLKHFKDTKIEDIGSAINDIYFGALMGYTKDADGNWIGQDGVQITDPFTILIANKQIKQVAQDDFVETLQNELTVGVIFPAMTDETNKDPLYAILDPNCKVHELDTYLKGKLPEIKVRQAINLGLFGTYFTENATAEDTLEQALGVDFDSDSISEFMGAVLDKVVDSVTTTP